MSKQPYSIRMDKKELKKIKRAAETVGMDTTTLIRKSAVDRAEKLMKEADGNGNGHVLCKIPWYAWKVVKIAYNSDNLKKYDDMEEK